MAKTTLKNFTINGITILAHNEDEAFEKYKEKRTILPNEIFKISGKYFRAICGKIFPLGGR